MPTIHARVTLTFRSDRGREYLYDDVTGSIFPWNELRERALSLDISGTFERDRALLEEHFAVADVEAAHRFIRRWRDMYGAFVRERRSGDWSACPPAEVLEQEIRARSLDLVLILTENCNLRCRYCILSAVYPLSRRRTERRMEIDTARRAVDWYVRLVEPQRARNPRKRFGLSFYGGEPMMNMPVLRDVLEHSRRQYPDTFLPVMTTNGTLLTPQNVETLAEHQVALAVSIDGPDVEHDRLRVDAQGRGTFARIAENLLHIKERYPEYWATKVTSVSVYDWGTDVEAVERFFADNQDVMPRSIFVNQVGHRNTDWYSRYNEADRAHITASLARLRDRYKTAKVAGDDTSHYLDSIVGAGILLALLRRRVQDQRPQFLPFSGACVPGDKVAVHVDGKIDMCERVNGTYPIGHLNAGGIDYVRLGEMIHRYQQQVLFACPQCPATKLCNVCFAYVEGNADHRKDGQLCSDTVEAARQRLADYISILESNPDADFSYETAAGRLEERLLFDY